MTATRATHQQIAEAVGVSRVAVSQVLHRSQGCRISAEKKAEILRVARQMGYTPRNFTTHNIGYVGKLDALALLGENRFLLLIDRALREANFRLVLTSLGSDDPKELRDTLNTKTVDGVIFNRWFDGRVRDILAPEIPYVVVSDEDAITPDVDKVTMDSRATMANVARYLVEMGHRRICLVTNPGTGSVPSHLKEGALQVLDKPEVRGELFPLEVVHDYEIAPVLKAMLQSGVAPTAYVAFGSEKAITTLNVLNYLGIRVPQDASLVSLVDSHMLSPLLPAVTATTASSEDVARRAVARLLKKIAEPETDPQHILIPGELILRDSVAPPPH